MKRAAFFISAAWLMACDPATPPGAPSATPSATAPTATATASASAQPPIYADEDLAVPADFEQQAEDDVEADNYKAKLEQMEQELGINRDAGAADAGGR